MPISMFANVSFHVSLQGKFLAQLWLVHPDTFCFEGVKKMCNDLKLGNLESSKYLGETGLRLMTPFLQFLEHLL